VARQVLAVMRVLPAGQLLLLVVSRLLLLLLLLLLGSH